MGCDGLHGSRADGGLLPMLVRRASAAALINSSLATLLTPLAGVFSAALLLPEPLGLREFSALILVLVAVSLAIRQG